MKQEVQVLQIAHMSKNNSCISANVIGHPFSIAQQLGQTFDHDIRRPRIAHANKTAIFLHICKCYATFFQYCTATRTEI